MCLPNWGDQNNFDLVCQHLVQHGWYHVELRGEGISPQTAPVHTQSIVVVCFWIWMQCDVSLQLMSQSGGKKICPASGQKRLDYLWVIPVGLVLELPRFSVRHSVGFAWNMPSNEIYVSQHAPMLSVSSTSSMVDV